MTHKDICKTVPVSSVKKGAEQLSHVWDDPERVQYFNEHKAYQLEVCLTAKCAASCLFCADACTEQTETHIPKERLFSLADEAKAIDIKVLGLDGGEALLHPHWFEVASYAIDRGFRCEILTSGMISKENAKKLVSLGEGMESVGVHLDTIDQTVYDRIHGNPKTLELRMKGYHNLLEAGYPPDHVHGMFTFTKPMVETLEETVDWFVDEMGSKSVFFCAMKPYGFALKNLKFWEPSLSDLKKAMEYRAKKLGNHWLRLGSSDATKFLCQGHIFVDFEGDVMPCGLFKDLSVGNIHKESLEELFYKHRDFLVFNFPVKGACGDCENSDICFGCRGNAYHYLGDYQASDPKCYLNPEAKEYYFREE